MRRYTLEQLQAYADHYDLRVFPTKGNQSTFLIVGDKTTIRLRVGEELPPVVPDPIPARYQHLYRVYLGSRFEHPTRAGVWVDPDKWTMTSNIMESLGAAMYLPPSEQVFDVQLVQMEMLKMYSAQNGKCCYCHRALPINRLTLDHVTPLSRGGKDMPTNWCLACKPCNNRKDNKTKEELCGSPLKLHRAAN